MTFRSGIFLALISGVVGAKSGWSQAIVSSPAGAVDLLIKGNSDTVLAVPLARRPVFSGRVLSHVPATTGFSFQVAGWPEWTGNQFAGRFHVRFTSGARSGMYYSILENAAARLTVDPAGDSLSAVLPGDTFQIVPYWTLGTLFLPTSAGTSVNPLTASADLSPAQRRSEVLLPDQVSAGINLPPAGRFFFTTAGWVADAAGNAPANDVILAPDSSFIVRQPAALSADVVWTATGGVVATSVVIPLATRASGKQDNFVGLVRPIDVRLVDSGLQSGFVDSLGKAGFQRRDTLLVFDPVGGGHNPSATRSYFRLAGTWYSDARGNPVADSDLLKAGSGFVIRKASQASGATAWWTNAPNY